VAWKARADDPDGLIQFWWDADNFTPTGVQWLRWVTDGLDATTPICLLCLW